MPQQSLSRREKVREYPAARFFGYYPGTVAVVTVATLTDHNVMSAGWHAALSAEPPLYGVAIAKERYTHALILEAQSFAINFLPFERAEAIAAAGSVSRHAGVDKFSRFSLGTDAPLATTAPILSDAYLSYECSLRDVFPTGDHDWFVGEVQALHYDPAAFDERWLFDTRNVRGAFYFGRSEYGAIEASGARVTFAPEGFRKNS